MSVFYFGKPWASDAVDGGRRIPTPVGELCYLCEEVIQADDQGYLRPGFRENGVVEKLYAHKECDLAHVLGGWGCISGTCSRCSGGDTDPEGGLSYRESALRVWAWVQLNGVS